MGPQVAGGLPRAAPGPWRGLPGRRRQAPRHPRRTAARASCVCALRGSGPRPPVQPVQGVCAKARAGCGEGWPRAAGRVATRGAGRPAGKGLCPAGCHGPGAKAGRAAMAPCPRGTGGRADEPGVPRPCRPARVAPPVPPGPCRPARAARPRPRHRHRPPRRPAPGMADRPSRAARAGGGRVPGVSGREVRQGASGQGVGNGCTRAGLSSRRHPHRRWGRHRPGWAQALPCPGRGAEKRRQGTVSRTRSRWRGVARPSPGLGGPRTVPARAGERDRAAKGPHHDGRWFPPLHRRRVGAIPWAWPMDGPQPRLWGGNLRKGGRPGPCRGRAAGRSACPEGRGCTPMRRRRAAPW